MRSLAETLISEFGATGRFIMNDNPDDPVTGESSGQSGSIAVTYFREYYKASELVENLILAGDAKVIFTLDSKPESNWSFEDSDRVEWNIVSVNPDAEAQGEKIYYTAQVRK